MPDSNAVADALKAGAREMGNAVEWQHLAQGVAAFLRATPATMRPWGMDEPSWREMCQRMAGKVEQAANG